MTSASHEDATRRITADSRTEDGSPHEHAEGAPGPRDLVDPGELTEGPADGDSGPREEQKRAGGM